MSAVLAVLLGVAVGAGTVALVGWPLVQHLRQELHIAHDRLYGAWQAGARIPDRPPEQPPEPPAPLPGDLQAFVDEWESPEAKAAQEDTIRRLLAQGKTAAQIGTTLTAQKDEAFSRRG